MSFTALNAIVQKAMRGDKKAFGELCQLDGKNILFACVKKMGNLHDGEDAAQEVFVRMQTSIDRLAAPEAYLVWVHKVIHSVCSNMRRSMTDPKRTSPYDEYEHIPEDNTAFLPEEYLLEAEKRRELMAVIDALPDDMEECVRLHYFNHLTAAQIAEIQGVSEAAVWKRLSRAREKLQATLTNKEKPTKATALLPMTALAELYKTEMAELISQAAVTRCIRAAGIPLAGGAAGTAVKVTLLSVCATAAVVGAAFVLPALPCGQSEGSQAAAPVIISSSWVAQAEAPLASAAPQTTLPSSLPGDDPAGRFPEEAGDMGAVESASLTDPSSAPVRTPSRPEQDEGQGGAATVVTPGTPDTTQRLLLAGWVYLDQPHAPTGNVARGLAGATLELTTGDGSRVLQTITTSTGRFDFTPTAPGAYRIRVRLPGGVRFLAAEGGGIQPIDEGTAWITHGGEAVLALPTAYSVLQGLQVPVYYPAKVTGQLALRTGGKGDFAGVQVLLQNEREETLATATAAADGSFVFASPPIEAQGDYTVLLAPDSAGFTAEAQGLPVKLAPGQSAEAGTLWLLAH